MFAAPLESIFLYYAYVMDFTKAKASIGRAEFTKLVRDTLSFEK